jgi:tight adherence protein C
MLFTRRLDLSESFVKRIFMPWIKQIGRLFGRLTPKGMFDELRHQLALAGHPLGLGPREFYGFRLVFTLVGFWLAYLMLRGGITPPVSTASVGLSGPLPTTSSSLGLFRLIGSGLALVICTYLPKTWLRRSVRKRKQAIRKGLPDALDMLSVCAEAGLGFDQSLQRVGDHWKTPLGAEFTRVVTEMGMGIPRRTALRNLADRLNVHELSSFVAVILQSDQLGMSITDTLHAQAKQMRIERRFQAQEQARKMPLKMLFPLLLLMFPAMFAVILGPMIPVLGELFYTLRTNTW